MEQEHTPLWSNERISKALGVVSDAQIDYSSSFNVSLHDAVKACHVIRDDYEAALSEQAQRIEQLEAEVTRLTKKADTTMECAEILKGMLGEANDESERLRAEVARLKAQPTPPVPSDVREAIRTYINALPYKDKMFGGPEPDVEAAYNTLVEYLTAQEGASDER